MKGDKAMNHLHAYTVVGVYPDDGDTYIGHETGVSPQDAVRQTEERLAVEAMAVFEGHLVSVSARGGNGHWYWD